MNEEDTNVDRALEAWTPMLPPADFADRVLAARAPLAPSVRPTRRMWRIAVPILAVAAVAMLVVGVSSQRKMSDAESPRAAQYASERTEAAAGSGSMVAAIAPIEQPGPSDAGIAQPSYEFDVPVVDPTSDSQIVIRAGESATIHEPAGGPVSIDFLFGNLCAEGGAIETAPDHRYLKKVFVAGRTRASQSLDSGAHVYRLRCRTGETAAEGRVNVVRDDGRRRLGIQQRQNDIELDGRSWRVSYQLRIPNIRVRMPAGATYVTATKNGGRAIEAPVHDGFALIPYDQLDDGEYVLVAEPTSLGAKRTTLIIDFDDTAPQVQIQEIRSAQSGAIIKGELRWGWGLEVNGAPVELNKKTGIFKAPIGFGPVVLHAQHRKYGHHFYLMMPITK